MKRIVSLCVFLLLAWARLGAQTPQYPNAKLLIETSELAGILSNPKLRLLDARPPEEYRQGHLPGAVNLPAPATDSLEANREGFPLPPERAEELFRTAGIKAGSQVVVYDDQGNRFAARVFYVLEFFGHSRVQVLNGGFRKWQSEGRPVTTARTEAAAGNFTPSPNPALIATSQWVKAHLNDPAVKLVDARSPAEFVGEKVQGPRGGHIPGAVNVEWTRVIQSGEIKTFLDSASLQRLFTGGQVTPTQEVVTYCQVGMRAADVYFALRLLGYEKVRIYDGSWQDWSAVPELPIEK
jgi:thiosulfate/3-mercaptopyruvate sulfurtransferase